MPDLRFDTDDIRQLAQIDAEITSTLSQLRELVEKTLTGLAGIEQNLRGNQVMSQDVTGPILMLERSYLDRFNHLQDAYHKLLQRRLELLSRQLAGGGDDSLWYRQQALTERLQAERLPSPSKFPDMGHNRRIPVERARKLLAGATPDYELYGQTLQNIWQTWQAAEKPDWAALAVSKSELGGDWYKPSSSEATPTDQREEPPPPPKPTETGRPTPPIRQREEVDRRTQHQNAEPPLEDEEVDEDEAVEYDLIGGLEISIEPEPAKPSTQPVPAPTIEPIVREESSVAPPVPAENAAPGYAPPRPTPSRSGPISAPDQKQASEGGGSVAQIEPTHFTAYAPKEVPPAQWVSLAAYIFRESASGMVENDAKQKFGSALAEMRHSKSAALREVEVGATITATPHLDGFTFNPESLSLKFVKAWHRFDFEMMAGRDRVNLASNGAITFSMGGVLVGEIPLSAFVGEGGKVEVKLVEAEPYQKIFCSYSHRDTKVVERVERAYRVLGFDYLRDATRLRSGQKWNQELLRWIDEAHIFQLFWSAAAAQSAYVEQEWRHALQQTRANFIRPVYWHKPLVAPPAELAQLHFAYDPQIQATPWWQSFAKIFGQRKP